MVEEALECHQKKKKRLLRRGQKKGPLDFTPTSRAASREDITTKKLIPGTVGRCRQPTSQLTGFSR